VNKVELLVYSIIIEYTKVYYCIIGIGCIAAPTATATRIILACRRYSVALAATVAMATRQDFALADG
jgi:hypothetical protein